MDVAYVFLCSVLWQRRRGQRAAWELTNALSSPNQTIRFGPVAYCPTFVRW